MRSSWLRTPTAVDPYSHLAVIYDHIMCHVNYPLWAHYISRLFKQKAAIPVVDVLDISCGTASLTLELAALNYRMSAFDESFDMVRAAGKKIAARRHRVGLWLGSMTAFRMSRLFDAVVCTYDSFNYCLKPESCVSVLQHAADTLAAGGLFVFDVCTEKNSRKYFQNYKENESTPAGTYTRQSYYSSAKRIQTNEFFIQNEDGADGQIFHETHRQRIYKLAEIAEFIPHDVFRIVGIYDGFTFRKGSERSDRVHFVLQKTAGG